MSMNRRTFLSDAFRAASRGITRGRTCEEGAWTSGEQCPPARSRVPYSYLFSMRDGIIVADNYRRAQRAYTIGRPRIQKLPDKKLGGQ